MAAWPPDRARVVQLSDTHFSATRRRPAALADGARLAARRPARPRRAHRRHRVRGPRRRRRPGVRQGASSTQSPAPVRRHPRQPRRRLLRATRPGGRRRIDAFRETWGDDRFTRDLAGWRLVGVDAYLLGDAEHDEWFARRRARRPTGARVRPPTGARRPRRRVGDAAGAAPAFERAIDRAPTSGSSPAATATRVHRDRAASWAPSLTMTGSDPDDRRRPPPRPRRAHAVDRRRPRPTASCGRGRSAA